MLCNQCLLFHLNIKEKSCCNERAMSQDCFVLQHRTVITCNNKTCTGRILLLIPLPISLFLTHSFPLPFTPPSLYYTNISCRFILCCEFERKVIWLYTVILYSTFVFIGVCEFGKETNLCGNFG